MIAGVLKANAGEPVCEQARIAIKSPTRQPAMIGFGAPRTKEKTGNERKLLGSIEAQAHHRVQIQTRTHCEAARCWICLKSVDGILGFTIGPITISRTLESNRCLTREVVRHEREHEQVYLDTAYRARRWLVEVLDTSLGTDPSRTHPDGDTGLAQATIGKHVHESIEHALQWMGEEARRRNAVLDTQASYRREAALRRKRCTTREGANGQGTMSMTGAR